MPTAVNGTLRPSYRAAAVTAAAVLALYVVTLAPTTAMWDASEYITAAYTLGIPHPPGNPLFVLLGRVASLLPLGNVAFRVNLLAAVCSALAAGIWFLVAERVLAQWIEVRWVRRTGAVLAALLSATAFTVWNQSVVNEKVYTVSLAFFAVVSWLTVLWCDDPDGRRADRILILIAYLIGLGYTNHPAGFLVGPAVATAVIVRRPRYILPAIATAGVLLIALLIARVSTVFAAVVAIGGLVAVWFVGRGVSESRPLGSFHSRYSVLFACVMALGFGLTPFAFEPIRAAHHPALNEGDPTGCKDQIGFACTFSDTTVQRLMDNVNRVQYGKPKLSERQAPLSAQMGMWWLYFKWQWLRDPHGDVPRPVQDVLALLFLSLGIAGGVVHYKRDRASFWFFGPLIATVTVALVVYMNFKYGASQSPELTDVAREVRDRDYFYLWSYSAWSVWAALGLVATWHFLAELVGPTPRWSSTAPVLLLGALPLVGNFRAASRAGEWATREWARDVLNSVEPYGILITGGDNDTFPLWYAQEVEGVRPDVTVAVTSLLNTDWYMRGLLRRPAVRYDEAAGPAVYRGKSWPLPAKPILSLTPEQLAQVPEYLDVREPLRFDQGDIHAIIDPRRLEVGVPLRSDLLVLQMLKDNAGVRPFYISRSTAGYAQALGLGAYALTQGLVTKIASAPLTASADTVALGGLGHIDVARGLALWKSYGFPAALIRRGDWVDRPSAGIPALYTITALALGQALEEQGRAAEAQSLRQRGLDIAEGARITDWFVGAAPPSPAPAAGSDAPRGTTVPARP
jgi:hypothetical protein